MFEGTFEIELGYDDPNCYEGNGERDQAHTHSKNALHHRDHNLRAAFVHVLADAAVSVLVIVGLVAGRQFLARRFWARVCLAGDDSGEYSRQPEAVAAGIP